MKRMAMFALVFVLVLSLAAPAFAVSGANGAGEGFGLHHAEHAVDNGGFTGAENPGLHEGLSGWPG